MFLLTKDTPKAAGIQYSFWEGLERLANLSLGLSEGEVSWLDPQANSMPNIQAQEGF